MWGQRSNNIIMGISLAKMMINHIQVGHRSPWVHYDIHDLLIKYNLNGVLKFHNNHSASPVLLLLGHCKYARNLQLQQFNKNWLLVSMYWHQTSKPWSLPLETYYFYQHIYALPQTPSVSNAEKLLKPKLKPKIKLRLWNFSYILHWSWYQ